MDPLTQAYNQLGIPQPTGEWLLQVAWFCWVAKRYAVVHQKPLTVKAKGHSISVGDYFQQQFDTGLSYYKGKLKQKLWSVLIYCVSKVESD